jgi:gamma-glutamyltranspeptidase / glutathione hydrolase
MRLGMEAQAAINAPRFHHQWMPDEILLESNFPGSLETALNARGHQTKRRDHVGLVNAIGIDPQSGERLGAADPRDQGAAVGY